MSGGRPKRKDSDRSGCRHRYRPSHSPQICRGWDRRFPGRAKACPPGRRGISNQKSGWMGPACYRRCGRSHLCPGPRRPGCEACKRDRWSGILCLKIRHRLPDSVSQRGTSRTRNPGVRDLPWRGRNAHPQIPALSPSRRRLEVMLQARIGGTDGRTDAGPGDRRRDYGLHETGRGGVTSCRIRPS